MRRWFGLVLCFLPLIARAQSQEDFHPENQGWNGLTRLVQIIESSGYTVSVEKQISWDTISPNDVPMFFHPQREGDPSPSPSSVATFLRKGGRVLIADDFGSSASTFSVLGLTRVPDLPPGLDSYGDNPSLPFAEPVPGHSLGVGVDLLLTNHPTVFRSALTPAFVFGRPPSKAEPDEQLYEVVVEGGLDEGRIIAVSDPSIFINNMLSYPGNETFVRNLLRHLAGASPGKGTFRIYVGKFTEYGTGEEAPLSSIPGAAAVQEFLRAFNEWLGGLSEYAPRGPLARFFASLLALFGVMMLLGRLSQQSIRYDGQWLGDNEKRIRALSPQLAHDGISDEDVLGAAFQVEVEEFLSQRERPIWELRPNDKQLEKSISSLLLEVRGLPPRAKPQQIAKLYREWVKKLQEVNLLEEWQRRSRG